MSIITNLLQTAKDALKPSEGLDTPPGAYEINPEELNYMQYYGPEESERPENFKVKDKKPSKGEKGKKKTQTSNNKNKTDKDSHKEENKPLDSVYNSQPPYNDNKSGMYSQSSIYPKYDSKKPPTFFTYKPLKNIKLVIILVEDSSEISKIKDKVTQIIKTFGASDLTYIIHYGKEVERKKVKHKTFSENDFQCTQEPDNEIAFYDALVEAACTINDCYMKTKEKETVKIQVTSVDVIGIGTCKDTCSIFPKDYSIKEFNDSTNKANITTKFFCLTEDSFIDAAEVGFRSIGSISKDY